MTTVPDPYSLRRFLDAQRAVYAHRECTRLVAAINGRSIEDIFGYPDHLKFHSSMTLFAHATDDNRVFLDALKKYYRSELDQPTLQRL